LEEVNIHNEENAFKECSSSASGPNRKFEI